ncbi:hypothetical protein P8C59_005906 [Phyllachora maydis]|uniref:Uncharacterized protein n=1 Tax=Phyllachora maydis TaxID=1825666 RepID=A0AAD9I6D9_9PEZI|nr:hypothetical protein P8C59_005906 [Phyllachora maydis]
MPPSHGARKFIPHPLTGTFVPVDAQPSDPDPGKDQDQYDEWGFLKGTPLKEQHNQAMESKAGPHHPPPAGARQSRSPDKSTTPKPEDYLWTHSRHHQHHYTATTGAESAYKHGLNPDGPRYHYTASSSAASANNHESEAAKTERDADQLLRNRELKRVGAKGCLKEETDMAQKKAGRQPESLAVSAGQRTLSRTPEKQTQTADRDGSTPTNQPDLPLRPSQSKKKTPGRGSNQVNVSPTKTTIAKRRHLDPLAPVDTSKTRMHMKLSAERKGANKTVAVQVPIPDERTEIPNPFEDAKSSAYSQDFDGGDFEDRLATDFGDVHISPLHVNKDNFSVFEGYQKWCGTPVDAEATTARPPAVRSPRRGRSKRAEDKSELQPSLMPPRRLLDEPENLYSPLTPYFQTTAGPVTRKAAKKLVGDNGWLGKTNEGEPGDRDGKKASPTRKGRFFNDLFKKAKDLVEFTNEKANRRSRESGKSDKTKSAEDKQHQQQQQHQHQQQQQQQQQHQQPGPRTLMVSLNPREQSLVYGELEFTLTTALDAFLTREFNAGRVDAGVLGKTAKKWEGLGRPKVLGFRYDLATQLKVVRQHADAFVFHGRPASTAAVCGQLDMMATDAKQMRLRTFCNPDTVLAKQLLDAAGLCRTVDASAELLEKMEEMIGFFRACVARERHFQRQALAVPAPDTAAAGSDESAQTTTPADGAARVSPEEEEEEEEEEDEGEDESDNESESSEDEMAGAVDNGSNRQGPAAHVAHGPSQSAADYRSTFYYPQNHPLGSQRVAMATYPYVYPYACHPHAGYAYNSYPHPPGYPAVGGYHATGPSAAGHAAAGHPAYPPMAWVQPQGPPPPATAAAAHVSRKKSKAALPGSHSQGSLHYGEAQTTVGDVAVAAHVPGRHGTGVARYHTDGGAQVRRKVRATVEHSAAMDPAEFAME